MNNFKFIFSFILLFITACMATTLQAQEKKNEKQALIENLVNAKNYVFLAQQAQPMAGRTIYLTSQYTLRVSGDTIGSDLPYYGRAYVAPINPAEAGIKFSSVNNSYKVEAKKKGRFEITISSQGAGDVRRLFLSISKNGYASLQVQNTNRQPISFLGYITSKEAAK